jgi:cytochrome c peroxidase
VSASRGDKAAGRRHSTSSLRIATVLAVSACLAYLSGCGGGDPNGADAFVRKVASTSPAASRKTALDYRSNLEGSPVTATVSVAELMNWAESRFPTLFPKGAPQFTIDYQGAQYTVRAYPGPAYLGVRDDGTVWGLGPFTTNVLVRYESVPYWQASVMADACSVDPGGSLCVSNQPASELDRQLRALIVANKLTGDPRGWRALPSIRDPLPQLGKLLFFSKALSVGQDTACASCHHPALGGGDHLALPIGAGASQPDVLGPGRQRPDGTILSGRSAPTFFNSALYDQFLFWDGRVESLNKVAGSGGHLSAIRTPSTEFGTADPQAGPNLLAAQARFPIVGEFEMRGKGLPELTPDQLRAHIAARLGNYASGAGQLPPSQWLQRFRDAFGQPGGTAEQLITFDNIMLAMAEFERSAVFVDNPWRRYVRGDLGALSDQAKRGAILFYKPVVEGGAACVQCHKGDFFTDEKFHAIAFPQIGPGVGDPLLEDNGRLRVSGESDLRRAFRTPSLLNVELTAPYSHAGAYGDLLSVMQHYAITSDAVNSFLNGKDWCNLPPFVQVPGCRSNTADVVRNTRAALSAVLAFRIANPSDGLPKINNDVFGPINGDEVVAFLLTLTDPCLRLRSCFGAWIPRPDEAPDGLQLNAVDAQGQAL